MSTKGRRVNNTSWRKMLITTLLQNKMPTRAILSMTGHKSATTLMHYDTLTNHTVERMTSILIPKSGSPQTPVQLQPPQTTTAISNPTLSKFDLGMSDLLTPAPVPTSTAAIEPWYSELLAPQTSGSSLWQLPPVMSPQQYAPYGFNPYIAPSTSYYQYNMMAMAQPHNHIRNQPSPQIGTNTGTINIHYHQQLQDREQ